MREPKVYWKKSHRCYYVNLGGKPVRLDPDEGKARDQYHQLMAGKRLVKPGCRAVELLDAFLEHVKVSCSAGTYGFYRRPLKSFADFIGNRRVSDLKTHDVTNWINRCHRVATGKHSKGKPTSDTYRYNLIRAVKRAFRWAENEDYIDVSPVRKVKLPPPRSRDVYLLPEQWGKLVAAIGRSRDGGCLLDIVTILKETGCRPQEARNVESRHFDRAERCWVFPVDESKGKKDSRVVLLNKRAFDVCQRLALKHPTGPLFRNSDDTPWKWRTLGTRLYRLSKNLHFHVCPYAVRHTFATDAIIRGVDLQTIATLMGHVDLRMLSRIYAHLRKRSDHLRAGLQKATGEVA
jgi:integrase